MKKINFNNYEKSTLKLEIQSMNPEKFINLLWKNNISINNITKINVTTLILELKLRDYNKIEGISKRTKTRIKILDRKGLVFLVITLKKKSTLVGGIIIFFILIYYLSTYIWGIDIDTTGNISPYEIRYQLREVGVVPGINKRNIDVYELEEMLIKKNDELMWIRIRIEGSKLKIHGINRQTPPNFIQDNTPCDLVAKKDGQIIRIYTISGTPNVEINEIVKKGQVIVQGKQGKEDKEYAVHAQGKVIARVTYEEMIEVPLKIKEKVRTGKKIENYYIQIVNNKIYLKNKLNNFKKYDKIVENNNFIKKEIYYEIEEEEIIKDVDKIKEEESEKLYKKIIDNFDKSVKIIDKIVEYEQREKALNVRVLVVAEENIAIPMEVSEDDTQE